MHVYEDEHDLGLPVPGRSQRRVLAIPRLAYRPPEIPKLSWQELAVKCGLTVYNGKVQHGVQQGL